MVIQNKCTDPCKKVYDIQMSQIIQCLELFQRIKRTFPLLMEKVIVDW